LPDIILDRPTTPTPISVSRKVDGRTVTVNLSAQQAKSLQRWIAAAKKLDRLVAKMEQLSLEATERMLHELPSPTRKAPVKHRHTQQGAEG
jgi:hypothetical protein